MKHHLKPTLGAVASLLALAAFGEEPLKPGTEATGESRSHVRHHRMDRLNGAAKASDILGMTVKNCQDEKLGRVDELAVDVETGRVVQVIVSTGGFIGIGDRLTAVPPGSLHHDVSNAVLHLDADKERLKASPAFETSNWAVCSDFEHLQATYRFYREESAFNFTRPELVVPDGKIKVEGAPKTDLALKEERTMIPLSRLSLLQKASKLMGMPVKNLQDETLGKVENLLVDLPSGRLVTVIVSSGGFLGIGDELSAVPPTALRFNSDRDVLRLDASREMVANAPHFQATRMPDFGQPVHAYGVYQAYRVTPYFGTNDVGTAGDETLSEAKRRERGLNALGQGAGSTDTDMTARIRKGIKAGKELSLNGQNVRVTTNKGQVTLRGSVDNAEEKDSIGAIAIAIALAENVDNQLEIRR